MDSICKPDRKQTHYEVLFDKIYKEIGEIEQKVDGVLSFGQSELKCVAEQDTPNISPLERDLKRILRRLSDLRTSIN